MRMVYLWMTTGLLVTTAVAVTVSATPSLLQLAMNPAVLIGAIIGELVLVMAIGFGLRRMSPGLATTLFLVYSAVNGFTLSLIFVVYNLGTIQVAFLSTAALFATMTVIGYTTQIDLTQYRSYFMIGLIGLVVAMVINIFLRSSAFDFAISIFGVLLFTALTAYDTQKIKRMAADPQIEADGSLSAKLSILGALTLYLDFVNLFLFLLRLFGGNRR
jgi:FtsH-binding integral membrane protein